MQRRSSLALRWTAALLLCVVLLSAWDVLRERVWGDPPLYPPQRAGTPLSTVTARLAIVLITRNREEYRQNVPRTLNAWSWYCEAWRSAQGGTLADARDVDFCERSVMLLIDYGSDEAVSVEEMALPSDRRLVVRRVEAPEGWNYLQAVAHAVHFLPNVERIVFLDACNFAAKGFPFEAFVRSDDALYFPNNERYFTTNSVLSRERWASFLSQLPLSVVRASGFEGIDQVVLWRFNMSRGPEMRHETHFDASVEAWLWRMLYPRDGRFYGPAKVRMVRLLLHILRNDPRAIEESADIRAKGSVCHAAFRPFCWRPLLRLASLWLVNRTLDTVVRLAFLTYPFYMGFNLGIFVLEYVPLVLGVVVQCAATWLFIRLANKYSVQVWSRVWQQRRRRRELHLG